MKDPEIRHLLFRYLSKRRGFNSESVFEEVPVDGGVVRADVVMASKVIECFEIKSEKDSLKRLLVQGYHYQKSFDKVTLVLATKHVEEALLMAPEWWGIMEVCSKKKLKILRPSQKNPSLNPYNMLGLLNSSEVRKGLKVITEEKGLARLGSAELKEVAVERLKIGEIRGLVNDVFRSREWKWRPSELAS